MTTKPKIIIGMGTCGLAAGARAVFEEAEKYIHEKKIDAQVIGVGCIGMCHEEPLLDIVMPKRTRVIYSRVTADMISKIIHSHIQKDKPEKGHVLSQMLPDDGANPYPSIPYYEEMPFNKKQHRIVLKNCGFINPLSINEYISRDGYEAAKKVLFSMKPEEIIDTVKRSGLRGRGGGGFPTGMKWELCRKAEGSPKYLICNADEGDPGAFMDRSVLEGDPHSVIEGMIIAAYAIGANQGYIYVRAEYPLAVKHLKVAIAQAREKDFLGKNILGSGFDFDIDLKQGAGAFVCGEETALIASIEGERGMPRSKPPFPANKGLWGKPTNINNVETFANVPQIILKGAGWYAGFGAEKSKGTKVFALTGKIKRPGLIEVPMGIPLKEIIFDIGGGVADGSRFKAVQTGGPSGGCIPAELIDTHVEYESLIAAGTMMGSGGMVVMDDSNCMVEMARFFLNFSTDESCGKCVPCRIGTKRLLEILERIVAGKSKENDLDLLASLGGTVKTASLCGLGQTAPNPVLSMIRYFRDEYVEHIKDKSCRTGACQALSRYIVNPDTCKMCGICVRECPVEAIADGTKKSKKPAFIDDEKCIRCGVCFEKCPFDVIYTKGAKKAGHVKEELSEVKA
ncbi:MAG: NADH-quinone oxidoreductase subunit NuoF [Nitrospirota bacterium]